MATRGTSSPADARAASLQAQALGLAGLLKLTSVDFQAAMSVDHFLHLNAAPCTHVAGGQYAMAPMVTSQAAGHDRTTVDAQMAIRAQRSPCDRPAAHRDPHFRFQSLA